MDRLHDVAIQASMTPPPNRILHSLAESVGLKLESGVDLQVTQKIAICVCLEELLINEEEVVRNK